MSSTPSYLFCIYCNAPEGRPHNEGCPKAGTVVKQESQMDNDLEAVMDQIEEKNEHCKKAEVLEKLIDAMQDARDIGLISPEVDGYPEIAKELAVLQHDLLSAKVTWLTLKIPLHHGLNGTDFAMRTEQKQLEALWEQFKLQGDQALKAGYFDDYVKGKTEEPASLDTTELLHALKGLALSTKLRDFISLRRDLENKTEPGDFATELKAVSADPIDCVIEAVKLALNAPSALDLLEQRTLPDTLAQSKAPVRNVVLEWAQRCLSRWTPKDDAPPLAIPVPIGDKSIKEYFSWEDEMGHPLNPAEVPTDRITAVLQGKEGHHLDQAYKDRLLKVLVKREAEEAHEY